ncbi:hypothetical protein AGMMS49991_04490 [Spirochaetia bacterium]|nr:hypothetical protein AGMMS49991_04490 [Spirochaetia bacterium]
MSKWSLPKDETVYKISEETAEKSVMQLVKYYRIDIDALPNADAQKSLEGALATLQDGFRRGLLETEIDDDGNMKVIQTLEKGGQPITYKEMTAKMKRVMDGYPEGTMFERQQALLGALCGFGKDVIGELKRYDLRLAEGLSIVFLSA